MITNKGEEQRGE